MRYQNQQLKSKTLASYLVSTSQPNSKKESSQERTSKPFRSQGKLVSKSEGTNVEGSKESSYAYSEWLGSKEHCTMHVNHSSDSKPLRDKGNQLPIQ